MEGKGAKKNIKTQNEMKWMTFSSPVLRSLAFGSLAP
jgi:hypothetical protein